MRSHEKVDLKSCLHAKEEMMMGGRVLYDFIVLNFMMDNLTALCQSGDNSSDEETEQHGVSMSQVDVL